MTELPNPAEQTPDDAPTTAPAVETYETTVRRAPKLGVFLLVGGALGALLTLIITSLFPADPAFGFAASYGYFLIYGVPFGVLVGALIGLALDRRSKRRTHTVVVEHERVDDDR
ncbi:MULTISPECIES: hypothetical protein [unclassified Salinibacterium]|uniref:hypothetical protein n=1 Tax=unclassified Salinibacterium TaxID=2632331 RepID=UPI001AB0490F|nr:MULTISPECIES: hypothetical protein [unclassified Salinibacterium]